MTKYPTTIAADHIPFECVAVVQLVRPCSRLHTTARIACIHLLHQYWPSHTCSDLLNGSFVPRLSHQYRSWRFETEYMVQRFEPMGNWAGRGLGTRLGLAYGISESFIQRLFAHHPSADDHPVFMPHVPKFRVCTKWRYLE